MYEGASGPSIFFTFIHSHQRTHRVSKGIGGLCELEFLQLCLEWLPDLQILCSFSWAPIKSQVGSQRILAHCSPGKYYLKGERLLCKGIRHQQFLFSKRRTKVLQAVAVPIVPFRSASHS